MTTINMQVSGDLYDGREVAWVEQSSFLRITSTAHRSLHLFENGANMPPKEATISSATLSLYTVGGYTNAQFNIHGELSALPALLDTSDNNDIDNRSRTTANTPVSETVTNNAWETFDVKDVVQEIVNLGTWNTSARMGIILVSNTGDYSSAGYKYSDGSFAAKLEISWTVTTANFTGTPLTGLYENTNQDAVTFDNTSTTTDSFTGGLAGWVWEYNKGAGWVQFSTAFEPTLDNLTAGTYSIRLTATSNDGTSDTLARTNYFTVGAEPVVTASVSGTPLSGEEPLNVVFTNNSTTDAGTIVSHNWERKLEPSGSYATFSVAEAPTVSFSTGTWSVRYTATIDLGTTGAQTHTSYITVTSPSAISVLRPWGTPGAPLIIPAKTPTTPLIPDPIPTGVTVRLTIGDITGRVIARLYVDIREVSWVLNNYGQCTFVIAKTDSRATEKILRFGNCVLLEFDNGLPSWGGIIDPPREWGDVDITVTAYSAEYLLDIRRLPWQVRYYDVTAGFIFENVITAANNYWPVGIKMGEVYYGGGLHSPEYTDKSLLWVIQESLVKNFGEGEFNVTAALVRGQRGMHIEFTANWYERVGSDKSNVILKETRNISSANLKEEGPIYNDIRLAGEAKEGEEDSGAYGPDDRIYSYYRANDSANKYRLRQYSETRNGVARQSTLDRTAVSFGSGLSKPRSITDLVVDDEAPDYFRQYGVGDFVWCELPSYGFDGGYNELLRVMGRKFTPETGLCALSVEEV